MNNFTQNVFTISKNSFKKFVAVCSFLLVSGLSFGQTNPTAQSLPYTQDFNSLTGTAPVYPAGFQGWNIAGSLSASYPIAIPNGNRAITVVTNTSSAIHVGDFIGKMGLYSSNNSLSSICLSIVTTNLTNIQVSFDAMTQRNENSRINELGLQYRVGTTGNFTNVSTGTYQNTLLPTNTTGTTSVNVLPRTATLPVGAEGQAVVQLRWVIRQVSGSGNNVGFAIDNVSVTGTSSGPTITASPAATAFTTTYGTASAVQSFTVTGSNLTAGITATAPTGFEVSSDGTTYGATASFGTTGGTLRIRLAATAAVGGSYNSQSISLVSTGATTININTTATGNTVTAKNLTITGLTTSNKVYDGTTSVSVTGTPSYIGLVNSESFSVSGTPTFAFATATVGTGKSITLTGSYLAPSANYTITQPSLTANITAVPLTISGITANDKTFDGTTTATVTGTPSYVGLVNSESFTVTGTPTFNFSDATVGTNKTVNVSGYTAPNSNYTITQPSLTASILAAVTPSIFTSGTLSAVNTTYGTASVTPTSFTVSGSSLTDDIVINALSGYEFSITSASSGFASSQTLVQSGGNVTATTVYVRLAATTSVGSYSGNIVVSSAGATSANVATSSSNVAPKALTITGLAANNKIYDGTTAVVVTGTAAYSGLVNSETFTVSDVVSYAFATSSVGTNKTIIQTGSYTVPSSNYTISQPSLTANVTTASLTVSASNQTKNFGSVSSTTGATEFTTSGLQGADAVGTVTLAYSGSPSGNLATATVGTYTITPSSASFTPGSSSNYTITYATGTLTINATVPSAPSISAVNPGNGTLSVVFTAGSNGGSAITNYLYSTDGGTTFISAGTTTSPILISGLTNGTTYDVQLIAVNAQGNSVASNNVQGTPSTTYPIYLQNFVTFVGSGTNYTISPTIINTNLNTSKWVSSSTLTGATGSSDYSLSMASVNGGTGTFTLTFNVANGYAATISAYSFWSLRNSSGAYANWAMTINGTPVGSGTSSTSGTNTGVLSIASPLTNLQGTVTVVLTLTGATSTAFYKLDDFNLIGSVDSLITAPVLATASGATVDAPFNVTFTDDAASQAWVAAPGTVVKVGATTLTSGYTINNGAITFTPASSVPATLLQTAGTKTITISKTGYVDATVSQVIGVGVPSNLTINTQPTAPIISGGALAAQPKVTVKDQYNNILSGISVTASVPTGQITNWSLGGTTTVTTDAVGAATFSGLTATNLSTTAFTTASILFTPNIGVATITSTPVFTVPAPASKLVITSITPTNPTVGVGFNVTIQSQNSLGVVTNMLTATGVDLTNTGGGSIGGTTTGTINASSSSVTISGVTLSSIDTGVTLTATQTSGTPALDPGTSASFDVLAAASQLAFGTTPPATGSIGTNLTTFTVRALRPDNTLDNAFTGNVTIQKVSGPGNIIGTTIVSAVAGIATFNLVQIDAVGSYSINAVSGSLTPTVVSGAIMISLANAPAIVFAGTSGCVTGGSGTWLTNTNWCGGTLPASINVAQFSNLGTNTTLSFNMNLPPAGSKSIGAIEFTNLNTINRTLINSSSIANGDITLNGVVVNSLPNVIIRNNSNSTLSINTGSNALGLILGNSIDNVINIDGSGGVSISAPISGANLLTKAGVGSGVLTLSGANTYSGGTRILSGTLQFGATNVLADASSVTLEGGILKTGVSTGFTETAGNFNLTASSTIALGSGVHTLSFASSSATWTTGALLTVTGWAGTSGVSGTSGKIIFGNSNSSLTTQQLDAISFSGYPVGAKILATGEIVPKTIPTVTPIVATYTYTGVSQGPNSITTLTPAPVSITYSYVGTGATTYGPSATAPLNAGTYSVVATVESDSEYYVTSSTATPFSIEKATLNITANDQSVCYGVAETTITSAGTYVVSGFVNSENSSVLSGSVSYTTNYTNTTAAGSTGIIITPVLSALSATNYQFSAVDGSITIIPIPTTADAGLDLLACEGNTITLGGNTPVSGTGSWSIISGTGGNVVSASDPNSTFTGTIGQTYVLRWTITLGTGLCSTSTDDVVVTIQRGVLDYFNLQAPSSATICEGSTFDAYGRVYENSVTESAGPGSGIEVEFGYNVSNTNPNTWTTWSNTNVSFNVQVGNNDEYKVTTGSLLPSGTYYFTFRYRINGCNWQYGGYSSTGGGAWNGSNNVSGILNINPSAIHTIALSSGSSTSTTCQNTSLGANIVYTVGGSASGAFVIGLPSGMSGFYSSGTFTISGTPNVTGVYNYTVTTSGNSCTPAVSANGTITVSSAIDYANLQYPGSGTICQGATLTAYGQLYEPGVTPGDGNQGGGITVEFGYANSNTNPNSWTNWDTASFNSTGGGNDNDEYQYTFTPPTSGTFYYTFRYKYGSCEQYGGYNSGGGGFWNGTTNVSGVLTVNPNTWTGATNNLWNVATNWSCGVVPNGTTDVVISSGTPTLDVNYTANSGTTLTINGTGSLIVNPTKILTVAGTAAFNDLPITFESDTDGTAMLGQVTGTITGASNVTVKRFIPQGKRAFRFLTPGVTTTSSISLNWQQATHITGSTTGANGFDITVTGNPSMYTYNNQVASGTGWTAIPNTNATTLLAGTGYRMLIRGDRTPTLITAASQQNMNAAITLSATGTLKTGQVVLNATTTPAINNTSNTTTDSFSLVGNPYVSPIDWEALGKSGLVDAYYGFEPNFGTGLVRGKYVVYSTASHTNNESTSHIGRYIQSGQAFMVKNTVAGTPGTLTFNESNKASTQASVFKSANTQNLTTSNAVLRLSVYDPNELALASYPIDGTVAVFGTDFTNDLGYGDVVKLMSTGENLGLFKDSKTLAIEALAPVENNDELLVKTTQFQANKSYTFKVSTEGFASDVTAYLVDQYLNTQSAINMEAQTFATFATTTDVNSYGADRFKIVFSNTALGNDSFERKTMVIYPNPVTDNTFSISVPSNVTGAIQVTVYNLVGQEMYSTTEQAQQTLTIRPNRVLAQGVYIVQITNDGKTTNSKITIQQ